MRIPFAFVLSLCIPILLGMQRPSDSCETSLDVSKAPHLVSGQSLASALESPILRRSLRHPLAKGLRPQVLYALDQVVEKGATALYVRWTSQRGETSTLTLELALVSAGESGQRAKLIASVPGLELHSERAKMEREIEFRFRDLSISPELRARLLAMAVPDAPSQLDHSFMALFAGTLQAIHEWRQAHPDFPLDATEFRASEVINPKIPQILTRLGFTPHLTLK